MGRREEPTWKLGTVGLTAERERGEINRKFQSKLTVTRNMIDRLGLEKELNGHMGCVNCLEWNSDGSILASASDDLHVILWDPFRYKQIHNIATGHTGNIFSVKFLTPDSIVTCAADGSVRARNIMTGDTLLECACHCGRVKRLASPPDNPFLLWSAGEDGLVLQHDLRTRHSCSTDAANVLVNLLTHMGRYAEAKCLAVNPRRPYQLAVGANDIYVRIYDTRMIKLARLEELQNYAPGAGRHLWETVRCSRPGYEKSDSNGMENVRYFAPGHLSMEPNGNTFPKKAVTYLAYSHDGNELLVNLGSEHVYLYDINANQKAMLLEDYIVYYNSRVAEDQERPPVKPGVEQRPLPEKVKRLKELANEHMNKGNFTVALELYNQAIADCPWSATLYSNRAATFMRREWAGDAYAALRDCYKSIELDPNYVKSHFRLAKSLMELRRPEEAQEVLRYFRERFPTFAETHAVSLLQKDIRLALEMMETRTAEEAPEGMMPGTRVERELRLYAYDYKARFLGHCNTTTDIKEASFLGPEANFVAAGSDDGGIFIWCRKSGNIIRCLRGDESIVNCVQMHPSMFLLATSGIESVVRLWSPRPEDGVKEVREVMDPRAAAVANQKRMRSDPFESMLLNISFAGGADRDMHSPACRAT